jgi:hypothetical protein
MYIAVLFIGIMNCTSVQPVVAVERTVFYRERSAGMYSAFPYAFGQVNASPSSHPFPLFSAPKLGSLTLMNFCVLISQVIIELPYALVQSIIYGVIVYSMIGFEWTAAKFFWYLFFGYFTLLYFTFYGMMAVGITPNHHIASIVSAAFYLIWNLFSGFIVPRPVIIFLTSLCLAIFIYFSSFLADIFILTHDLQSVPIWWRWYCWACPVAWSLYGLVVSQFGDIMTPIEDGRSVKLYVEDHFGFKHDWLGIVATVVVSFCLLFGTLFGFAIMKLNFHKR